MKNLKKLMTTVMLALFVALTFSACKDDDKGAPSSDDLLGKWQVNSIEYVEKENGKVVDSGTEYYHGDEFAIIFKPNNVCVIIEDGYEEEDGEWFLSGKTLVLWDEEVWTIEKRTSKTMTLSYTDSWSYDGIKYTDEMVMNLTKVW